MKRKNKKLVILLAVFSCLLAVMICLLFALPDPNKPVNSDVSATGGASSETGADQQTNQDTHQPGQEQVWSTDPTVAETEGPQSMPWEEPGAKQPEDYTKEEYDALTSAQRKAFREFLGENGFAAWLEQSEAEVNPWELPGAKQPEDYTQEEYDALTEAQKAAFLEYLGPYGLEAWLNKDQTQNQGQSQDKEQNQNQNQGENDYPWSKPGAKQPQDYTLAEYHALTQTEKVAFVNHLGADGFQKWLTKVQGQKTQNPWEKPGAKQPREYTREEYESLTEAQKKAFREFLGARGFEAWEKWSQEEKNPWEETGSKKPADYSWEEYEALTEAQKKAFQEFLGAEAFVSWMQSVQQMEGSNPWDKPGAKQPENYDWNEYKTLTEIQQTAFQNHLGSAGFKTWLKKVANAPWYKAGAKQPANYTWKEYEALTEAQQLAFQTHLGAEGFEEWLLEAQHPAETNPWEKPGAKQPENYSWKEFEALTQGQQVAFQTYLGTEGFEKWKSKVQGQSTVNPWEKPGAKQPKDYTWKDYLALTAAQQMAFQNHMGSDAFEAWLNKVQTTTAKYPWEASGAKQPKDYTWEEFEALTAEQQMAFQKHLGPAAFEVWLNKVQTSTEKYPWEASGAKQPKDYTWEEFEVLTAEQQMAFQKHLGPEGFDAWLNQNKPS